MIHHCPCSDCETDPCTCPSLEQVIERLEAELATVTSERDDYRHMLTQMDVRIEQVETERDDYRESNEFLNNEVGKLTKELEDCLLQLEGAMAATKLSRAEVEAVFRRAYWLGFEDADTHQGYHENLQWREFVKENARIKDKL